MLKVIYIICNSKPLKTIAIIYIMDSDFVKKSNFYVVSCFLYFCMINKTCKFACGVTLFENCILNVIIKKRKDYATLKVKFN